MRRRPRLRPRSGARLEDVQGAQGLEARHSERCARSRRLVGLLSGPQARIPHQTGRNLEPDRCSAGSRLRTGARVDPGSAGGPVPGLERNLQRHAGVQRPGDGRRRSRSPPPRRGAHIRRPSFRSFPGPGISMSGARCGDKSRATLPRRRPAPPTSTMPSFRRRRSSQSPITTCARPMRCATCSIAPSRNTRRRSASCKTSSKQATRSRPRDVATAEAQVFTTEAIGSSTSACSARNSSTPLPYWSAARPPSCRSGRIRSAAAFREFRSRFHLRCSSGVPTSPPRNEPCRSKTR